MYRNRQNGIHIVQDGAITLRTFASFISDEIHGEGIIQDHLLLILDLSLLFSLFSELLMWLVLVLARRFNMVCWV